MLAVASDEPEAHAAILDGLFTGPLAAFAGRIAAAPKGGRPAADLTDRAVFDGLVDRFHLGYPGADRRAAASLWSQVYFGNLIVTAVLTGLALGRALPVNLEQTRIRFCPETGVPLSFLLDDFGHRTGAPTIAAAVLAPLLDGHVTPLVDTIRRHTGLSRRLLWENAGWPLFWILGEAVRLFPACRPAVEDMLADPAWPDRR